MMDIPEEQLRFDFALKTKLYLTEADGDSFMGIGVLWLLQYIDSFGSIRKAAAHMNLSYVKAHRMLTELEKHMNFKVVDRKKGGDKREGATLTQQGRTFVAAYDRFQAKVKQQAEPLFEEFKQEIKTGLQQPSQNPDK
ncbi:MAG: LysR family transcriptional regulator [Spirochaetia bacterium]